VNLDPIRRRGLVNGAIAAVITLVVGIGVVMGVTADDAEPPPVGSPTATASSPAPPPCTPAWEVAQSANPGELPNQLSGVAVVTGTEAWAVGGSGDPAAPSSVLIELWNGTAWTAEEVEAPGTEINELLAVDVSESSPNDVWAVGRTASGFGDRPLVLHYDGTQWLPQEIPSEIDGVLTGVAALSPTNVWVVGYVVDSVTSIEHALVLHWDGLLWAVVDPGRATGVGRSALLDVETSAEDDLWAVGYLHNDPLIVHFDGEEWTRGETPIPGTTNAVWPVSPTDVWAVGSPIQHLQGSAWAAAAEVRAEGELFGVAAVGAEDVWAVGMRTGSAGGSSSLVMRFDGDVWTTLDEQPVAGSDALLDIDALADGTIMAVGYRDVAAGRRTFAALGSTCSSASP
jgi:hypothetical protein